MYLYNSPFIRDISYINSFDNLELSDDVVQNFKLELLQKTLQFDNLKLRGIRISIISLSVSFAIIMFLYKVIHLNILWSTLPVIISSIVLHIMLGIVDSYHTHCIYRDVLVYRRAKRLYRIFHTYHFDDANLADDSYYRHVEHEDFVNTNVQY